MTAVPDLIQPAWERLDPHTCQLGESPFWHPQEQSLYWVDISGKQLLRMHAGVLQTWDMPSEPGCIVPARSGGLVIALRHGIFRAHQWGGALTHIATLAYDTSTVPTQKRPSASHLPSLARTVVVSYASVAMSVNAPPH